MFAKHYVSHHLFCMKLAFVNRKAELGELDASARRGGLLVLSGRRRVGKTRLLRHWMDGPKRTLYQIMDPALRFWFSVHSPHRSLWRTYPPAKKRLLIHGHAASVFEDWYRSLHPAAGRYWEKNLVIDLVCPDPDDADGLLVGEAKWKRLSRTDKARVLHDLEGKWGRCALAARHPKVRFKVFDAEFLNRRNHE
jgi:AAA+ ATPase superfamily predicted ATPase